MAYLIACRDALRPRFHQRRGRRDYVGYCLSRMLLTRRLCDGQSSRAKATNCETLSL